MLARLGTKMRKKFTNPRKDSTRSFDWGSGMAVKARTLSFDGEMPSLEIWCPSHSMFRLPNNVFVRLSLRLFFYHWELVLFY